MDSPEEHQQLAQNLERLRARLLDKMHDTADAEVRAQMQVAADRIQDGAIPFVKDYRKIQADLDQRLQETKKKAEATIAKAEEAQQKIAEAEEQAKLPPPPPPAEAPIDPGLGPKLRDELLDLFGDRPAPAGSPAGSGSLWSALKQMKGHSHESNQ